MTVTISIDGDSPLSSPRAARRHNKAAEQFAALVAEQLGVEVEHLPAEIPAAPASPNVRVDVDDPRDALQRAIDEQMAGGPMTVVLHGKGAEAVAKKLAGYSHIRVVVNEGEPEPRSVMARQEIAAPVVAEAVSRDPDACRSPKCAGRIGDTGRCDGCGLVYTGEGWTQTSGEVWFRQATHTRSVRASVTFNDADDRFNGRPTTFTLTGNLHDTPPGPWVAKVLEIKP